MRTLNATEFKAKCLKVLDHLGPEGVVITKRGHPIAKVLPFRQASVAELYGCMKGKLKIKGNIFSTGVKWNAGS